jgi:uncharacterized ubiquitin-like protein YukD
LKSLEKGQKINLNLNGIEGDVSLLELIKLSFELQLEVYKKIKEEIIGLTELQKKEYLYREQNIIKTTEISLARFLRNNIEDK